MGTSAVYFRNVLPTVLLNALLLFVAGDICEMSMDDQLRHAALFTLLFLFLDLAERRFFRSRNGVYTRPVLVISGALTIARDLLVTPLYILGAITYASWTECFRAKYLLSPWGHIHGLAITFGVQVYFYFALAVLALVGWVAWRIKTVRKRIDRLVQVPPAVPGKLGSRPDLACILVFVLLLDLFHISNKNGLLENTLHDPVLSFYFAGFSRSHNERNTVWLRETAKARDAYPSSAHQYKTDVIIFVVDSLRADHLPLYGYERDTSPFLSSLYRDEHMGRVDFAVSAGNCTIQGVFGILSSRFAVRQYVGAFMVNEALKKQGYIGRVIASGDQTKLYGMTPYYGNDFALISDGLSPSQLSINDDERVIETLKSLPPRGDAPGFFYIHLMSVHQLGYVRDEFRRWTTEHPTKAEAKINACDNGILQADDTIRRSLEILRTKGYLSEYLLFITGDHGDGHGEHDHFQHGISLYNEDIRVPLLWKDSRLSSTPSYHFASHVDIAPTILERLGLSIPSVWDGCPFEKAGTRPITYVSSLLRNGWRALIRPEKQDEVYMYLLHDNRRVSEKIFRASEDPQELHDLFAQKTKAEIEALRSAGDTFFSQ